METPEPDTTKSADTLTSTDNSSSSFNGDQERISNSSRTRGISNIMSADADDRRPMQQAGIPEMTSKIAGDNDTASETTEEGSLPEQSEPTCEKKKKVEDAQLSFGPCDFCGENCPCEDMFPDCRFPKEPCDCSACPEVVRPSTKASVRPAKCHSTKLPAEPAKATVSPLLTALNPKAPLFYYSRERRGSITLDEQQRLAPASRASILKCVNQGQH